MVSKEKPHRGWLGAAQQLTFAAAQADIRRNRRSELRAASEILIEAGVSARKHWDRVVKETSLDPTAIWNVATEQDLHDRIGAIVTNYTVSIAALKAAPGSAAIRMVLADLQTRARAFQAVLVGFDDQSWGVLNLAEEIDRPPGDLSTPAAIIDVIIELSHSIERSVDRALLTAFPPSRRGKKRDTAAVSSQGQLRLLANNARAFRISLNALEEVSIDWLFAVGNAGVPGASSLRALGAPLSTPQQVQDLQALISSLSDMLSSNIDVWRNLVIDALDRISTLALLAAHDVREIFGETNAGNHNANTASHAIWSAPLQVLVGSCIDLFAEVCSPCSFDRRPRTSPDSLSSMNADQELVFSEAVRIDGRCSKSNACWQFVLRTFRAAIGARSGRQHNLEAAFAVGVADHADFVRQADGGFG